MNNPSFFERPNIQKETLPIGGGIPFALEMVHNPSLGVGGVYGTWGERYTNEQIGELISLRCGEPLKSAEAVNLAELGFLSRHHIPHLTDDEHLELELEVGARLLQQAAVANGWKPEEVQAVLIGVSGPVSEDYVAEICQRAGIAAEALKVSIHKACDGSVSGLHLALNPRLAREGELNIAEELRGKKVLVGGIEGLSRFISRSYDKLALQLFGNAAGVIGVIPGETFRFLVGKSHEAFDQEGVLAVRMYYPHSRRSKDGSLVDVRQESPTHIRVAGLMHEPEDGSSIAMAGPLGMVKLFVRTGVQVVADVVKEYSALMSKLGIPGRELAIGIVHHANYKINQLKAKHLQNLGIQLPMPWLLSDFGNVSAASNMIAFLRHLPKLKLGDHVLFDGFGAGTYYDVVVVSLGA
jgi:3-oxoacyl-[acyl-carrier-protein] synthase III